MCATAGDGDVEISPARHHRPGANLKLADRQSRPVVHAKDCVAREAVEQTVGDHRRAAAKTFFGGLKDQMHRAVEIAGLGKYRAAPSSIVVCPSWPQACIRPLFREL